jgi:hypothetical protein
VGGGGGAAVGGGALLLRREQRVDVAIVARLIEAKDTGHRHSSFVLIFDAT